MSSSNSNNETLLTPQTVIGGAKAIAILGITNICEVWRALDVTAHKEVVVKLVHPDWTRAPERSESLGKHLHALTQLFHPYVLPVLRCGVRGGIHFFITELTRDSVEQKLYRKGVFPLNAACGILSQVVQGLDYAWSLGVAHGSLKPGNVMLDKSGTAKVADFGVARNVLVQSRDSSSTAFEIGPEYMSPELAMGNAYDFRSDIYSLGILMYQMVMGDLPYKGDTPRQILALQLKQPLPDPPALREMRNGDVLKLLSRMTAKDPDERPSSYGEIAACLSAILGDLPLSEVSFVRAMPDVLRQMPSLSSDASAVRNAPVSSPAPVDNPPVPEPVQSTAVPDAPGWPEADDSSGEEIEEAAANEPDTQPEIAEAASDFEAGLPEVEMEGMVPSSFVDEAPAAAAEVAEPAMVSGVVERDGATEDYGAEDELDFHAEFEVVEDDQSSHSELVAAPSPAEKAAVEVEFEPHLPAEKESTPEPAVEVAPPALTRGPSRRLLLAAGAVSALAALAGIVVIVLMLVRQKPPGRTNEVARVEQPSPAAGKGMPVKVPTPAPTATPVEVRVSQTPGLVVPPPLPSATPEAVAPTVAPTAAPPAAPTGEDSGVPFLSNVGKSSQASAGIRSAPSIASPSPTSAAMVPLKEVISVLPAAPAVEPGFTIIVDDLTPNGLVLSPPEAWRESAEASRSYGGSARVALVDGQAKTATFIADIPQTGKYEVSLYWTPAAESLRSPSVPVSVHDASGWQPGTVNQVGTQTGFNVLGTYQLEAGNGRELVRITTEGIPQSTAVHVSVDALKLVKVAD